MKKNTKPIITEYRDGCSFSARVKYLIHFTDGRVEMAYRLAHAKALAAKG